MWGPLRTSVSGVRRRSLKGLQLGLQLQWAGVGVLWASLGTQGAWNMVGAKAPWSLSGRDWLDFSIVAAQPLAMLYGFLWLP